ncbi:hypothetical protein [Streptomyces sp. NPDC091268]|uniref:hypothetical protein n=1 Tax=Streptomyces sp. NPDC091268 TaxID=3365979 RepID=UPI00380E22F2
MRLPADRIALDLLDAHLEALWDGACPPSAQTPDRLAAGGGGELAAWALGRLQRIPQEPGDAFVRHVGSLLWEFRSRRCPWNAAAVRLLDDPYTFVSTGPRRHEDWGRDVRAVMERSVGDPRGWLRLDGDRTNPARATLPAYPFELPDSCAWPGPLYALEAEAAVGALAVMAEEWQSEPAPVRSRPDRHAVLADSRTLLERYGPGARYWTNATAAATDPAPDFVAAGLSGTRSHSFLTGACLGGLDLFDDLGLIAVSDDEVGVFWSICAY